MASYQTPDNQTHAPNREELLQMAILSAKRGDKRAARLMFEQVLKQDQNNERAMMWLAKIADAKNERHEWLTRVLRVNPNNDIARDALKRMAYKRSASDNRTLLTFGVVAGVLIVLALVIVLVLVTRPV